MRKTKVKMRLKNENAITLIALVITIIVLLILAAVTISALSGENGILSNATKAKSKSEIAEEKEKIKIVWNAVSVGNLKGTTTTEMTAEKLQEECDLEGIGVTVYGDKIPTFVFGDSNRCYTINDTGTICGPSYGITGVNEDLKITQGSFKTLYVYVGKVATLSLSTTKEGKVERVIIYDNNGEDVGELLRFGLNTKNDDRDIATSIFEVYGNAGVRRYTAIAIDSNGKRSTNLFYDEIEVKN